MAEDALRSDGDREAVVEELVVEVGEMTGVLPEYLEKYFPAAAKGTRFQDSSFRAELIPVEAECRGCRKTYHPSAENGYRCPFCRSAEAGILHGRELNLKELRLREKA